MNAIVTERLELVLKSRAECLAMVESFAPEVRAECSKDWLARLEASTDPDPWVHGFTVRLIGSEVKVGDCGFKAPPDAEGMVEVAYGIEPEHQRRGYATEATEGMVKIASACPEVRTIRAHTLPDNAASARVLTKCGFRNLGEVIEPDDGLVWRWERSSAR